MNGIFTYVREALGSPFPSLTTLHLAEHLMLIDEYSGEFSNEIVHLLQASPSPYVNLLSRLINPQSPSGNRYINIENDCLQANGSLMQGKRI